MRPITFIVFLFLFRSLIAQPNIVLLENQVEIAPKTQVEYVFGFAPGDRFELHLNLSKSKLSEITILNLSDSTEIRESRVSQFEYKSEEFTKEELFLFRLSNNQVLPRDAVIKIIRDPSDEKMSGYNCSVEWMTHRDTVWEYMEYNDTVGFDTIHVEKTELLLDSLYHYEMQLLNDSTIVPAKSGHNNWAKPVKTLPITFPEFNNKKHEQRRLESWAFAVGVIATGVGTILNPSFEPKKTDHPSDLNFIGDMSELGAYASSLVQVFKLPLSDRQYQYYLMNAFQAQSFLHSVQFKYIIGVFATGGFHRFENKDNEWTEVHYLGVENNDHNFNVHIKASAVGIVEVKTFKDTTYTSVELEPIIEKRMGDRPLITSSRVPRAIGLRKD